jgi:hypothetical protein
MIDFERNKLDGISTKVPIEGNALEVGVDH